MAFVSPWPPSSCCVCLYFNDESYVGWVQGGDVVEVMTTDPVQGEVLYALSQENDGRPKFIRDRGQCISCHASHRTQGVPGGLVRSVFVDARGQPQFGSGTFTIDHHSPFEERWGGWYVKGTSSFAKDFEARGPHDSPGRSLRDFDLQTRMFKYPCSYMIYSQSFDRLPDTVMQYVLPRLHDVLTGRDTSEEFSHLSSDDRKAILEILNETTPGLWER